MVGPKGCGKTQISNFLSNQTDTLVIGRIEPTAGRGGWINNFLLTKLWVYVGEWCVWVFMSMDV